MITLALDTSTAVGSVALLHDGQALGEQHFDRRHGDGNVFDAANSLLRENGRQISEVELVAVGVGPGSFAGIRAGIAAAKGMALPRGIPIQAIASFDALAVGVVQQTPSQCQRLCVLGDARRGEVCYAFYSREGLALEGCRLGLLSSVLEPLEAPVWFVSSEMEKFEGMLRASRNDRAWPCSECQYPSALVLGRLAEKRYRHREKPSKDDLEPIYLRPTQYQTMR